MVVPRLANDADDLRLRGQKGFQLGIGPGPAARSPRRAKGHQLGVPKGDFLSGACEELVVFGQRSGPPSFDVVNPEFVQQHRNLQLVPNGQGDTLLLRTVSQRGVVDLQGFGRRLHR